ncbi:MAG: aldo/keto reductase [Clostridiales bacterium]|jgi:aryl-alcohol dehydrogenase-like predicted oxidoreductase|nr:aldo/keto reductase [Clostridiales bacterium]
MIYGKIGGAKVSRIGMGCWAFGGGAYWGEQAQKDVDDVVRAALDSGINFFDTAQMYNDGASEKSLGAALKGARKSAYICSKVSPAKAYYKALKAACEESLTNLDTDYIDLYMLHWPINPLGIKHFTTDPAVISAPPTAEDAFRALSDLKKEGKIRDIGISNFGIKQMREALSVCPEIVANELPYNIISRAIEAEILPLCKERNLAIITAMTLQQGVLTGAFKSAAEIPPYQAHSRHFANGRGQGTSRHGEAGAEAEVFETVDLLRELSARLNASVPQLATAWALANPQITCALIGSRDKAQLDDNLKSLNVKIPQAAIDKINAVSLKVLKKLGDSPDYYEKSTESRIY